MKNLHILELMNADEQLLVLQDHCFSKLLQNMEDDHYSGRMGGIYPLFDTKSRSFSSKLS